MLSMMILLCSVFHGGLCYNYPPVTSYSSSTHSAQVLQATFTVSNQAYGNGLYTGKVSSLYPTAPENDLYAAFDNDDSTFYTETWHNYDTCTSTACSYTGGINSVYGGSSSIGGEWIQLTLPSPIQLNSFYIATRNTEIKRMATAGVMLGSNDGGSSFSLIQSFTDSNIVVTKTIAVTSSVSYSTFRLVVTKTGGNSWLSIATFRLNSAPSAGPTAAPSTIAPSKGPTAVPSTVAPSKGPTAAPSTVTPSTGPTAAPSTVTPSADPTAAPSTVAPSTDPTAASTVAPSVGPTAILSTVAPSTDPTAAPSTAAPSAGPTTAPTLGYVSE